MPATLPTTDPVHSGLSLGQLAAFMADYAQQLATRRAAENALRERCGRRILMPAGWVTGTISGTVAVSNLASSQNTYFHRIAAATAGVGRLNSYNAAVTYPYALFPGTTQVINWDMPWFLEWTSTVITGTTGVARMLFGKAGGASTVADETLTAKGLGVQWTGGAGAQTVGLIGWDTALRTAAATGSQSNTAGASVGYQLLWLPGVGATLYADSQIVSTLDANLPSGLGASGDAGVQLIVKNTAGNASLVEAAHGYPVLTHLNPAYNA